MKILNDVDVTLVQNVGDDQSVVHSAKVSTAADKSLLDATEATTKGLIGFLMKNRHGSVFEHNSMTFYIKAPIFVFREFHRHRIGWSYNEMSGRYMELPDDFYIPAAGRPLVQEGKPGHYVYVSGTAEQQALVQDELKESYKTAWQSYQTLLADNVAKEVARLVLPVGIFSQMYATCNARSLMAFLSLRTKEETSMFPSYPQHEIELVARKMEAFFAELMPITYAAFNESGRVAP